MVDWLLKTFQVRPQHWDIIQITSVLGISMPESANDERAATRRPARALRRICRGEWLVQIAKHAASGFLQLRAAARDINASARSRSPLRSATDPSNESARELRGSDSRARRAKVSTELNSPLVLASCLCASSSSAIGSHGAITSAPSGSETAKRCPAVSATMYTATTTSATSARARTVVASQFRERATRSRFRLASPFRLSSIALPLDLPMGQGDEWGRIRDILLPAPIAHQQTLGTNQIEWHRPQSPLPPTMQR